MNSYSIPAIDVNVRGIIYRGTFPDMEKSGIRLKWARKRAGFETAVDAAVALGVTASTYYNHEKGNRGFGKHAEQYSRKFKVPVDWLVFGTGTPPDGAPQTEPEDFPDPLPEMTIEVREIDVRAGAGGGGLVAQAYGFVVDGETTDPVKDRWGFPKTFVAGQLRTSAGNLDMVEVLGDSMEPTLSSGDRVVVDVAHKNHEPFELELTEGHIIGRVVAKISTRV